jgi:polyisoprenoid-binding protein YceI
MKRLKSGASRAMWICLGASLLAARGDLCAPVRAEQGTLSSRRDYRIDRGRSRVTVETHSTSLLSSSTHRHLLAARDFRGQVSLVPEAMDTTVVDFNVRADSLSILDDMSEPSRHDIDLAIRRTLEASRFPRIVFHSSKATAGPLGSDIHDVTATGTLELHGVRRPLTLSAQVGLDGDTLRIRGTCTLRQTDYGLVPFSLGQGTIKVEDDVTLTFDLVATGRAP